MPALHLKSLGRERDPRCNFGTKETNLSPLRVISPVEQRQDENEQALDSSERTWPAYRGCHSPLGAFNAQLLKTPFVFKLLVTNTQDSTQILCGSSILCGFVTCSINLQSQRSRVSVSLTEQRKTGESSSLKNKYNGFGFIIIQDKSFRL